MESVDHQEGALRQAANNEMGTLPSTADALKSYHSVPKHPQQHSPLFHSNSPTSRQLEWQSKEGTYNGGLPNTSRDPAYRPAVAPSPGTPSSSPPTIWCSVWNTKGNAHLDWWRSKVELDSWTPWSETQTARNLPVIPEILALHFTCTYLPCALTHAQPGYTFKSFTYKMTCSFEAHQLDAITTYLNRDLSKEIYLGPPEGVLSNSETIWWFKKALYGLKQAGLEYTIPQCNIQSIGDTQSRCDHACMHKASLLSFALDFIGLGMHWEGVLENNAWMDILSHFVYSIIDCLHSFVPDVFSGFPQFSTRVTEPCLVCILTKRQLPVIANEERSDKLDEGI